MPTPGDPPTLPPRRDTRRLILDQMGNALGLAQAQALLRDTCRQLGISEESLSKDDAIRVLEVLAGREGLVGVAARFLKVRLILVPR